MHSPLRYLRLVLALAVGAPRAQASSLAVYTEASPEGLDAAQYTSAVTAEAAGEPLFNHLLAFKPGKIELEPRNGSSPTIPNPALAAQMLQADLAKAGITLIIRALEWGELLKRAKAGEHDLVLLDWAGDNGDPDNFLSPNLSCAAAETGENQARWCDPTFEALIGKARAASDPVARASLYQEALGVFHRQSPWIPLAHPRLFNVRRTTVEGYTISPMSNNNFARTRVR